MVHVLTEILHKVGKSLRDHGLLLITQPTHENTIVEVKVKDEIIFRDELKEHNFHTYLQATEKAIHAVLAERLFKKMKEGETPKPGSYYQNVYNSPTAWKDSSQPLCDDLDELFALYEKIQTVVAGRECIVLEYWREYSILMQK